MKVRTDSDVAANSLYQRIGGRDGLKVLLRHFYADVRQHDVIGPVFAAKIEDWPTHIEKIADFWSGATGGPPAYAGPMPWKHIPLGLEEKHFEAWLGLWARHCQIHLPETEGEEMRELAEAIGQRLRHIIAAHGGQMPGTGTSA